MTVPDVGPDRPEDAPSHGEWRLEQPRASDEFEPSPIVGPLLRSVPEFVPSYLTLVAGCEDNPGEPTILTELADFIVDRHLTLREEHTLMARALRVVEHHLESMDDDPEGCELVAYAFFDSFSPEWRASLVSIVGPRSRLLLEDLDGPWADSPD
jgi:hypothetical protein